MALFWSLRFSGSFLSSYFAILAQAFSILVIVFMVFLLCVVVGFPITKAGAQNDVAYGVWFSRREWLANIVWVSFVIWLALNKWVTVIRWRALDFGFLKNWARFIYLDASILVTRLCILGFFEYHDSLSALGFV